jgi:hypothetical protein
VSRIPLNDGFQMLLTAGLAPDKAAEILNRETAAGGALNLVIVVGERKWPSRGQFRFTYDRARDRIRVMPVNPMELTLMGPLIGLMQKARFEFGADQVKALIETLAKPKDKRARSKPSEHKAWALEQLRKLIERGDKNPQRTLLKRWPKEWRIRDRDARQRLQRNLLRWKNEVEAEIAAERKSVI